MAKKKKRTKNHSNNVNNNNNNNKANQKKGSENNNNSNVDNNSKPQLKSELQQGISDCIEKNFSSAKDHFTVAISLSRSFEDIKYLLCSILNRAIVSLKNCEWDQALDDSNLAILIDENCIKAYVCRAFANFYLLNLSAGFSDFTEAKKLALQTQPNNKTLQKNLDSAKKTLENEIKERENSGKSTKSKSNQKFVVKPLVWISDFNLLSIEKTNDIKIEINEKNDSLSNQNENQNRENQQKKNRSAMPKTQSNSAIKKDLKRNNRENNNNNNDENSSNDWNWSWSSSVSEHCGTLPLLVPVGEVLSKDTDNQGNLMKKRASDQMMMASAIKEKEQGNRAFSEANYLLALMYYSRAIKLNNGEPVFFSNRALVYLKLNRFYECITDCTASIERNPSIKAFARRAAAWANLKEYFLAAEDYRTALKFEPRNQDCLSELERCLLAIELSCRTKLQQGTNNDTLKSTLKVTLEDLKRLRTILKSQ